MLKSLDWAKAIAEKRATLITSLDCIFAVGVYGMKSVKSCEDVGKSGKRAYERRKLELDGDDGNGRNPRAEVRRIFVEGANFEVDACGMVNRKEACGRSP